MESQQTNVPETLEEVMEPSKERENENLIKIGILKVKEKLGDVEVKSNTMHIIIKYVIETVERFPTTGLERKELSLSIIKDLVNELPESSEKIFIQDTLSNGLISNTIDLIVSASKGELSINVVEEVVKSCVPSCFKYIKSKFVK